MNQDLFFVFLFFLWYSQKFRSFPYSFMTISSLPSSFHTSSAFKWATVTEGVMGRIDAQVMKLILGRWKDRSPLSAPPSSATNRNQSHRVLLQLWKSNETPETNQAIALIWDREGRPSSCPSPLGDVIKTVSIRQTLQSRHQYLLYRPSSVRSF